MSSRKYKILGISIILLLSISALFSYNRLYNWNQVLFTEYGYWDNWARIYNLSIPKPKEIVLVFDGFGPSGEGEVYGICIYDSNTIQEVQKLGIWKKIDSNEENEIISKRVESFKKMVLNFKVPSNPFQKYPIELNKSSLYYLKINNDGSWLLALLSLNEAKIYVMEAGM
ncbi:hypothetical protein L1N85_24165 [Paenibacillus alkaliterrae]|nr:hypothetical protein [Paenibacillus alkaliterrae]